MRTSTVSYAFCLTQPELYSAKSAPKRQKAGGDIQRRLTIEMEVTLLSADPVTWQSKYVQEVTMSGYRAS
jgi:hypothetical protein